MYSVEGRENKKAEKNEKQRSEEKKPELFGKKSPNFGLCACAKVKFCTFLPEIFLKILLQCKKMHFWQSLEKFSTVAPKNQFNGFLE